MHATPQTSPNVKQLVPFFLVAHKDRSPLFYTELVGFTLKNKWVVDEKVRSAWLELGGAALMLQECPKEGALGLGVSLCFQCEDALSLYHEFIARGIPASASFVGNSMWVTNFNDPDGYRLEFESPTTVPEETKLSDLRP